MTILIISYNTRELTLACLRSVFEQARDAAFEVIVVDNQSSDGSADAVAAAFPQVKLIRAERNLGFAGANNLAAKEASGDYLLLLNPDTVVLDKAIDKLLAFAKANPEAGIWGGRTVFADGSLNPASCWAKATLWSLWCQATFLTAAFRRTRLFNPEAFGGWRRDTVRQVDIVSGCFFLIRRDLWEQLNGFDPAFFMYGEEADLCLRAHKLGARPLVTPDATIVHYGGASEKVRAGKLVRLFKAKALLFERHASPTRTAVAKHLLDLWVLTRLAAFALLRRFKPARRNEYDTWREVWTQRQAWHNLDAASVTPSSATAASTVS